MQCIVGRYIPLSWYPAPSYTPKGPFSVRGTLASSGVGTGVPFGNIDSHFNPNSAKVVILKW